MIAMDEVEMAWMKVTVMKLVDPAAADTAVATLEPLPKGDDSKKVQIDEMSAPYPT